MKKRIRGLAPLSEQPASVREGHETLKTARYNNDNYGYPSDWPKCPGCGFPALDGHITCGRAECNEGARR